VVLGLDARSGNVIWRTTLAQGTDLTWGTPTAANDEAVFLSTPSHIGSADGQMAHLIELDRGTIRWAVNLGGDHGFHYVPAVIDGTYVHLPSPSYDMVTVDRADGKLVWQKPGPWPFMSGEQLWAWGDGGPVATLDPATGRVLQRVESPVQAPARLFDLGNGVIGVMSTIEIAAIDADGNVRFRQQFPAPLIDVPLVDGDLLVATTSDRSVHAYALVRE
jgi:outer membrane protein assembly factor BamB